MSFSELLFTFQPFPRPRFRMIVCPIIPFALPRDRILTRPVARMLATLVFPLFSFFRLLNKYARPARRPRTYLARARKRISLLKISLLFAVFPLTLDFRRRFVL